MAKDAKGHGSETRGSMSVPDRHQHSIARDTVKNPLKGVFLGGPSAAQAEDTLRSKFGYNDAAIAKLKGGQSAADVLAAPGHPKSVPVRTHPAMSKPLASDPVHRTSPIDGQYFKRK